MALSDNYLRLALAGGVLIYAAAFLLEYSGTPLGLYPVLDGREMLELAHRIATGGLPAEPHYRAPLYPAVLAVLLKAGVAVADLPMAARLLNGALHLVSTFYVWIVAAELWRSRAAAALAVALFGFNPVVLHFAADPLDITLAMTLALVGLRHGLRALSAAASRRDDVLAGGFLALAVLARPQLLLILLAWLALAAARYWRRPQALPRGIAALAPVALVFAGMGAANHALSGDFRILPWQGAYNLWAANGPGANGRYFVQSGRVAVYTSGTNPARVESERRYRELNPQGARDYASMSRFWYARTFAAIADDPLRWLRLVAVKAWYLLNNFEQYDIKTYHFHKVRSDWLRWNPLCWTLVLAPAMAGLALGWRQPAVRALGWCALAYTGGLLLTYVNARFRLPLVPLLAILAGGVMQPVRGRAAVRTAVLATAVAGLSMWPLSSAETGKTLVQDHLLLARAAVALGMNADALTHAHAALAKAPGSEAAREILCVAQFNRWLMDGGGDADPIMASCEEAAAISPVARRLLGTLYWRHGRRDEATALWQALVAGRTAEADAALAALIMTDRIGLDAVRLDWSRAAEIDPMLLLVLAVRGHPAARAALARRMPPDEIARQRAALEQAFAGSVR